MNTLEALDEVSATDTWCMLVGSCLQCRGASVIWFVNHWWHLTSSTLISVWPCMLHAWTLEYQHMMLWYAMRLMVDTYERRKAMASWRRPPGCPRNVWFNKVQEDANALLQLCSCLRCGDLRSPGATERRNGSLGLRDDDDNDEGWLVSKMEGKTNVSRHVQAVRNRDCWRYENH